MHNSVNVLNATELYLRVVKMANFFMYIKKKQNINQFNQKKIKPKNCRCLVRG